MASFPHTLTLHNKRILLAHGKVQRMTIKACAQKVGVSHVSRRHALALIGASGTLTATPATRADDSTNYGEGVRGVDLLVGADSGKAVEEGDTVKVRLKGRLMAKNGWVFLDDGLADNDRVFTVGRDGKDVIRGLEVALLGMRAGGVRRVILPPPVSYTQPGQEPQPSDGAFKRRLESTIFNPTRLANGEGDTLATTMFDVELVRILTP